MTPTSPAWRCQVCGTITPTASFRRPRICPTCHGECDPYDSATGRPPAPERVYPLRVEVDYYGQEEDGVPYEVHTAIVEVPRSCDLELLPFLLTKKVGKHYGVRRTRIAKHG